MLPVTVTRTQASLTDPDLATAQTVEVMCDQIKRASAFPIVRNAALDSVQRFQGGPLYSLIWRTGHCSVSPDKNPGAIAESIWWAAKHAIRFEHHERTIRVWFNERDQLQLLISPELLPWMQKPRGDCAIFTTLICAMLRACAVPYEIVTAAVDPHAPSIFGHVYPRTVLPGGYRLVLDASHGDYPGWEVPREHTLRKQVWSDDGQPIADDSPQFNGLHAYIPWNAPVVWARPGFHGVRRRGMRGVMRRRGLGDSLSVDDSGNPIDGGTYTGSTYPVLDTNPGGAYGGNLSLPGYTQTPPAATPSTGPGSGFNLPAFLASITGQGLNLVGKIVAPTTTIQSGPGGTFIQTPAGTALPSTLSLPGIGGAASGSWLLIGGLAVVVVLVIAAAKK